MARRVTRHPQPLLHLGHLRAGLRLFGLQLRHGALLVGRLAL
jgi:hypothetical protein